MGRIVCIAAVTAVCCGMTQGQADKLYPDRWVYVSRNPRLPEHVAEIRQIAQTAADHGLNGMLLAAGLDRLSLQPPEYFDGLKQVRQICDERGIEIIPIIFSVGYGGSVLGHNSNLAAGLPVRDAPFVVDGDAAQIESDPPVEIVNGGFEEFDGDRCQGYGFHDKPGEVSFADREVFHGGKASLRFDCGRTDEHGHARFMQEIAVQPHRVYRVALWAKAADLQPAGTFAVQIYTEKRALTSARPRLQATTDWTEVTLIFNSGDNEKLKIYGGLWGGRSGKLWVDDLSVQELGLRCVLRRPGTPLTVNSQDGRTTYEEGRDFAEIADPNLRRFSGAHDGPPIKLLPGSRIKDGERLRVSFYHGAALGTGQVSACMSEPELYEIWRQEAALLKQHLAPQRYFLSMDEIRAGGSCAACRARGMTMGEILGDCITQQVQILRETTPDAPVYIWSDMLDPGHNAHGDYYLVEGDFTGSWERVPKDLIICCWWHQERERSLKFFSDLGFATLAGAYYDANNLQGCRDWLDALDRTPNARGIMYTTWQNKYDLLAGFGDLVNRR